MEIIQINANTWRFEDNFVRFFLLEGDKMSLLLDSGATVTNALELARTLTDKTIILANTHGDGDHTAGTEAFSEIYMHAEDYINCEVNKRYPNTSLVELDDNDIIDLGHRIIKVIHIPGHTKGSLAFLDTNQKTLYSGDSVQKGHIYMFGSKRCPKQYAASLDKLISLQDEYTNIYASHDDFCLPNDYVQKVKAAWELVQSGSMPYETISLHGSSVKSYTTDTCGFYTD